MFPIKQWIIIIIIIENKHTIKIQFKQPIIVCGFRFFFQLVQSKFSTFLFDIW
jgi:hypothetical protein